MLDLKKIDTPTQEDVNKIQGEFNSIIEMIPPHTVKMIKTSIELICSKVKNTSIPFKMFSISQEPSIRKKTVLQGEKIDFSTNCSFKIGDDISALKGNDLLIDGIQGSIDFPIILSSCLLRNIVGNHCIRIGPVKATVILENISSGLNLYCCAQQIRLYQCHGITLFVFSLTGIVMEECSDITVRALVEPWFKEMEAGMASLGYYKDLTNINVSDFSKIS